MGKSGGESGASKLAELVNLQNYRAAKPIQQQVYGRLGNFMSGGLDVSRSPIWQAGKIGAEGAYQSGMENMMNSMPAGGALYSGMAELEGNRADSLTQLMAQVAQDEYAKAYGVASGDPQQSTSNLIKIGQQADRMNAQEAANETQAAGSAAASLATIIASIIAA